MRQGQPVNVTIHCGCGLIISVDAKLDQSHYDAFDTACRFYDQHIASDEKEGLCRPWIGPVRHVHG